MQEDFYQNSIRGQASGEYIHVEDSSNCRSIIGISGNHEQETREGYNLLNFDVKQNSKVTYNKEDGSITINGQGGFILAYSSVKYEANKTYTQIMELVSGTVTEASGENAGNNRSEFIMAQNQKWFHSGSPEEFTSGEDTIGDGFWCNVNAMFNNARIRIWAYEGTEDKPYEQYGVSPSPDYPNSIVAVGSNVNLFDKESVEKDYRLGSTGDLFQDKGYFTSDYIELSINTNYTLSINETGVSTAYVIYDKDKKFISRFLTSNNKTYLITNNTSSKQYIRIASYLTDIDNVKFEKGIVATPYSTYRMGSVGIDVVNKNLLDKNLIDRNISYTYGIIGEVPKPQKGLNYRGTLSVENAIEIKPNTNYVITVPAGIKFAVAQLESNLKSLGDTGWLLSAKSPYILTTQHNAKYIGFNFGKDDNSNFTDSEWDSFINGYLQLEAGTTATDFVEHQSQSYIMPIQQEMLADDYIDGVEHHTWKKIILTGNEPFYIDDVYHGIAQFTVHLPVGGLSIKDDTVRILSNYFKGVGYNNSWTIDNSVTILDLNNFRIMTSQFTTVKDFKAWLKAQYDAGTPVMIYYKLQTPTRLAFTDEQKAVAKELNNARTYKNVTNITTDSKAILSLDYAKDLETLLNNTQALAVNNASEGV